MQGAGAAGAAAPPQRVRKVMKQPINMLFDFLQAQTRVSVWLYENTRVRMEGTIVGMDEYMNLVLDDAVEVTDVREGEDEEPVRTELGRILLKGDTITLVQPARP